MLLSIIIDTYPMNPMTKDYGWRIIDTKTKRVEAYGFKKTLKECFDDASLSLEKINAILQLPKSSSYWTVGYGENKKDEKRL